MISTVSLSILRKNIRDIFCKRGISDVGCFVVVCCMIFVPFGASIIYGYKSNNRLSFLEKQLLRLGERYKILQDYENRRQNYKNLYLQSNSTYLQTVIAKIIPLQEEIEYLKRIIPFYPPDYSSALIKRLHFLQSENRFQFHEIARNKQVFLEEVLIEQATPIELNMHDLQKVLFQLEGISQKNSPTTQLERPQILINHLDLCKDVHRGTFTMKLTLIQRESKQ